jgi:hypothetical protein
VSLELRDARGSAADREWLTRVYPFYQHDLSEFDDGYYRLDEGGRWTPGPPARLARRRDRSPADPDRVR